MPTSELSKSELLQLEECELTISNTHGAFVACGLALAKIRDLKLYRLKSSTFDDYCQQRWGWKRARAYQIMEAAEIVSQLPEDEQNLIENERQARAIKNNASEPKMSTNPTKVVDILKTTKTVKKVVNLDNTGAEIPDDILGLWKIAQQEGRELLSLASKLKCTIEQAKKDDNPIFREVSQSAESYAVNIYTSLKQIIPYAVCTSCQGHNPKRCVLCKGRGFFSEFLWKNAIPQEIKKMRAECIR